MKDIASQITSEKETHAVNVTGKYDGPVPTSSAAVRLLTCANG